MLSSIKKLSFLPLWRDAEEEVCPEHQQRNLLEYLHNRRKPIVSIIISGIIEKREKTKTLSTGFPRTRNQNPVTIV